VGSRRSSDTISFVYDFTAEFVVLRFCFADSSYIYGPRFPENRRDAVDQLCSLPIVIPVESEEVHLQKDGGG